jgi:hypothetical protein
VTGNRRPEAEQLVVSANRTQEATSNWGQGEDSCHPARRLDLTAGTGSDDGVKDFPDATAGGILGDPSRIPAAAGRSAPRIARFLAEADQCTAIYSIARGVQGP